MPTYICRSPRGLLDPTAKANLAAAITRAHTEATGADGFFAQVLFADVDSADAFLGGRPLTEPICFIHGHIRAGRAATERDRLIRSLALATATIASLPARAVWVYVTEMPARAMIEYGQVLPEPGEEGAWLADLPSDLRERLVPS